MKKRIAITFGLVLMLCLAFTSLVFATQTTTQSDITYRSIKINVNGSQIAPVDANGASTEPFILNSNGTTYLPVRAVADALGLQVGWDDSTSTVILNSNGTVKNSDTVPAATNLTKKALLTYRDIKITLDGSQIALVNAQGEVVEPFIYNNSTYLPVRAVATALGCTVSWDGSTSTVYLIKNEDEQENVFTFLRDCAISKGTNFSGVYTLKYYTSSDGTGTASLEYLASADKINIRVASISEKMTTNSVLTFTSDLKKPYEGRFISYYNGSLALDAKTKVEPSTFSSTDTATFYNSTGFSAGNITTDTAAGKTYSASVYLGISALDQTLLVPNGYSSEDLGFTAD